MQDHHVEEIAAAWRERTGAEPPALRGFLLEALPDVAAWALRRETGEPEVLALSGDHLFRVEGSEVEGQRALGFERWALADIHLAMVEWVAGDTRHRRWTLRMPDAAFEVVTQDGSAAERLMRRLL